MAWKATLGLVEKTGFSLRLVVEFSDGSRTVSREFLVGGPSSLKALVSPILAQLQALDDFAATLPLGLVDTTPDPPSVPTALEKWLVLRKTYTRLKDELEQGLNGTTQADVDAAYAAMKADYLPEYGAFL